MNLPPATQGWDVGMVVAWLDRMPLSVAAVYGTSDLMLVAGLVVSVTGVIAWLWHRRVKREIEQRFSARNRQMTELIEKAQCLLWEAEVLMETDDWAWHVRMHPSAFCRQLMEGRIPGPKEDMWAQFEVERRSDMDDRAWDAIQEGRPGYEQEFRATREGRTYWLHENVSITKLGTDRYWLVGLVTDITAQREAEAARRQSEQTVERILAHAPCLIWRATVMEENGELQWPHFDMPDSQLSQQLFGDKWLFSHISGFWDKLEVPDLPEMNLRSSRAIRGGETGYEQQFRVISRNGRIFWVNERVSITQTGDKVWSLVGVVTDVTAQTEAELARKSSERQLAHLLERADTLIWQAKAERRADGWLNWSMFIPPSQLYRRLFAEDPVQSGGFDWKARGVPEDDEMKARCLAALNKGEPGYEQVFRVPMGSDYIWLSESVTIDPTGPDSWDLVGVLTDITARRRAEEAWHASQLRLGKLLDLADCMVWEATVKVRADDTLEWDQYIPPSALYRRIFGEPRSEGPQLRWDELTVPEYSEMVARTLQAVKTRTPGYQQEFRVIKPEGEIWLREIVTMILLEDGRFRMVGVITDITAQRRAEEAQRQSEVRLTALLEQADCMIWQGECQLRAPDDFHWRVFTPRSHLFQRIFGREPDGECHFNWNENNVPEFQEMRARSRRALVEGQNGYEQTFRYQHADGDIWLHEKVSIKPAGSDRWELIGIITDITAQKRSDEARQASDQRLQELLGRAECLLWEADVEVVPGVEVLTGWKWRVRTQPSLLYQRLCGKSSPAPQAAVWPADRVPDRAKMDELCRDALLARRAGYEQIFHYIKEDGTVVWISENVTIRQTGENRLSLVGVAVDVTAQRLSEAARQESEQRLAEILTRADCLLWEATAEISSDDWQWQFNIQPSVLCQRLYGEAKPPSSYGLWRKFTIPERAEMNQRCRRAMSEGLASYEQVFHIVQPGKNAIWIRENVTIRRLDQTRFSLVGVAVDITRQRGAEEALAAEKERLAVTLRAMTEAVITTDVGGRVQFMNPAAARLLEREPTDCIGRPVQSSCQLEHMHTGAPIAMPVERVSQGDVMIDLPGHTRLVTSSGKRRSVEGCCAPVHSAESKVTGTVLVMRDVTEQERLEQELVRATRLESVGVLAGGIAHDFNNILTAVMGNLALAQLDIPPDNRAAASLRSAEKAALRARDLTQQLLTFAKGGEPVRAAIQLESVVREMTTFALHGSQVKAHFEMSPDLWTADADKGQIGRVVQNLVINAVQAMPRGGTLHISARNDPHAGLNQPGLAPGKYLQIAITDTGEGISPENVARIFDPYFTTKQTGTGLGLAAVYSIIKKHRGHIEVESQPGQGTTFRFWLPALDEQAPARETRTPWANDPRDMIRGRVLFMDDEESIREMARSLLHRFGLTVDCTADGAEAVARYSEALAAGRRYDLVIMDLTVPGGMGGLAALEKLRELDPQVKAVVSSGYSSDPVLARYREHGFAAVVAKPYEVGEISRVLRELLPPR